MGGHEERTHRRFSPSQSERFLACPGSTALLERTPARENSKYALEGTMAHDILEAGLRNSVRRAIIAHREHSMYCFDDFEDNNDAYYSVQIALNHVYEILDEYPDAIMYLETYVDPPLPSAPGEAGGYCDIAIFVPSIRRLYVIDYKHGAGIAKAAKGNTQPLQYAAGFLYQDSPLVKPEDIDEVYVQIVQPRAFHEDGQIREVVLTPFEVYEYLGTLETGVAECLSPRAALNPGEWCDTTFCDARTTCPAREAMALNRAVSTFNNIYDVKAPEIPNPKHMDVQRLSYIAQAAPMLRAFLDDVDNHVEELMRIGYDVPGFKLIETQARREWWGDESDIAFQLSALAGISVTDVYRIKLLTITEAERVVVEAFKARAGRGKKKQAAEDAKRLVAQLTLKKSSGAVKMAPADDPSPAINRALTSFANVGLLPPPTQNTGTDT